MQRLQVRRLPLLSPHAPETPPSRPPSRLGGVLRFAPLCQLCQARQHRRLETCVQLVVEVVFVNALGASFGCDGAVLVNSGTTDTFKSSDVFNLQAQLPPRFQPNSVWMANLSVINLMRQMETTNGARLFPELSNTTPSLLGRPIYENSVMDGTINASAENLLLAVGQPSQYLICDKIGSTLEIVQNLFGSNRRPTGQRGALLWFRTGGDSLVDNSWRLLDCT